MSCVRISEANPEITRDQDRSVPIPHDVNIRNSLTKCTKEKHIYVGMLLFHSFVFNF